MERGEEKSLVKVSKHWHWERDRDSLVWLTFDKQGESANTFSREALEELGSAIGAIHCLL